MGDKYTPFLQIQNTVVSLQRKPATPRCTGAASHTHRVTYIYNILMASHHLHVVISLVFPIGPHERFDLVESGGDTERANMKMSLIATSCHRVGHTDVCPAPGYKPAVCSFGHRNPNPRVSPHPPASIRGLRQQSTRFVGGLWGSCYGRTT